jgi:CRP-like cAMP-binding protein
MGASPISLHRHDRRHPQARACAACEVRRSALFGALDEAALDGIHTHIASLVLEPDTAVYGRGSAGSAVYTVRAGVVRFERTTERGDRRIVRLAGRGDLIGQEALLQRPYADEAVACTPVQLCRIPRTLVDDLAREGSGVPRELMLRWQAALDAAEAWVADLSTGLSRRRLLRLLLRLAEYADAGGVIWLPRREEIGAMLDMTIETASRLVSQLRREGVLSPVSPREARLDRARLRAALEAQDAT